MADELTLQALQDVVNHMSNGFAQLNGRMDRLEGRMDRLESDVKGLKSDVMGIKQQLHLINDRLTSIEEDLVASRGHRRHQARAENAEPQACSPGIARRPCYLIRQRCPVTP